MGIGIVLLFYLVGALVAAAIGSAVLSGLTEWMLRSYKRPRKRAMWIATALPFACVAFAGCWFVVYAIVNQAVFHRDPGFGDSWETPLPNGYALSAIDVTDFGQVYNPSHGNVNEDSSAIFGVHRLQISGKHIYGAQDTAYVQHFAETLVDNQFFDLDTASGRLMVWRSESDLLAAMAREHVTPQLRSFADVFGEYRTNWFAGFAALIGVLVPIGAVIAFVYWLFGMRRESQRAIAA